MIRQQVGRRDFLQTTSLALAGLGLGMDARAGEGKAGQIRLGGPVFNAPEDPAELARHYRKLGYRAAYCPNVALGQGDRIRALEAAFQKEGVAIAEVGRWVNLMDADPAKRVDHFKQVRDGLALADEIGAFCCVDIAGSMNPKIWYGPHPDNFGRAFFELAVENARKLIDDVKPRRAKFAYEMMGWAPPHGVDNMLQFIKAVDRKAFAVHLDPCNLVNSPERFYRNADLLNDCFDRLGQWIVSCHAKDLAWEVEMNVHFKEVCPGQGQLDYATFLKRLAALPHQPPLMIEHLATEAEYTQAREHILGVAAKLGIST